MSPHHYLSEVVTPVHLAAVSVGSSLVAAVSFAIDGPTITAVVAALLAMGGAVAKVWRASVSAASEVAVLRMQVAEQAKQIETLRRLLSRQADAIRKIG